MFKQEIGGVWHMYCRFTTGLHDMIAMSRTPILVSSSQKTQKKIEKIEKRRKPINLNVANLMALEFDIQVD